MQPLSSGILPFSKRKLTYYKKNHFSRAPRAILIPNANVSSMEIVVSRWKHIQLIFAFDFA